MVNIGGRPARVTGNTKIANDLAKIIDALGIGKDTAEGPEIVHLAVAVEEWRSGVADDFPPVVYAASVTLWAAENAEISDCIVRAAFGCGQQ